MSKVCCILDLQPLKFSHRNQHDTTTICRRSCNEISYNDFYWNHMHTNWPVVLTGISNVWHCRQHWTIRETDNINDEASDSATSINANTAINYDYLKHKVGNCLVPVANCSREYFNSHEKSEMNFHDFLDYWQVKCQQEINHNAIVTKETICNSNSNLVEPTVKTENLYLKDWHLKAQMPDYDFYIVPKYFASDWLNEYLIDSGKDDYRFVYMGPKESWTSFHSDVFGSYSWSTNIVGCKRWLLLPPGEENRLKDHLGNLPQRITEHLLKERFARYFIIEQTENESLFVPSGWYHQVHNVTDTISVNHNWFNACNVHQIWLNLATNMRQVIAEIEDCRQMDNFDEHCHTMLRASFGLNFYDFLEMLEYITKKRLRTANNNNNAQSVKEKMAIQNAEISSKEILGENSDKYLLFNTYTLNDYHIRYDLHCINKVVQAMLQNDVICKHTCEGSLHCRCLSLKDLTKQF